MPGRRKAGSTAPLPRDVVRECPRCAVRDKLSPVETVEGGGGKLRKWLQDNEAARDIIELWLEMVPAGESVVSMAGLHKMLKIDHKLPFQDSTGFGRRLREIYGDRYEAVMEITRR